MAKAGIRAGLWVLWVRGHHLMRAEIVEAGELWRRIRKGPDSVYLEYGHTHATLLATDLKYRVGPPFAVSIDLNGNLRGRSETGTKIDARGLADGELADLHFLQFLMEDAVSIARAFNDHADDSGQVELHIELSGHHRFQTRAEAKADSVFLWVLKDSEAPQ